MALGWSVTDIGTFFAVLSLVMVLVQGPLLGRLAHVVSDAVLIAFGTVALSVGFGLLLFGDTSIIYAGAGLMALGNGLMWPTFMAVLSRRADGPVQGAVQGLASSLGAAASIFGLIGGGLLYTQIGPWVFVVSAATITGVLIVTFAARGEDAFIAQ